MMESSRGDYSSVNARNERNGVYPVYHALADVCEMEGGNLVRGISSDSANGLLRILARPTDEAPSQRTRTNEEI
jgi:hypothetical protein